MNEKELIEAEIKLTKRFGGDDVLISKIINSDNPLRLLHRYQMALIDAQDSIENEYFKKINK
jgi:hypothetical protein